MVHGPFHARFQIPDRSEFGDKVFRGSTDHVSADLLRTLLPENILNEAAKTLPFGLLTDHANLDAKTFSARF